MELQLDWKMAYNVRKPPALTAILDTHQAVFTNELGTITCAKAEIHVDPQIPPSFHTHHLVPFALKPKVKAQLE